MHDAFLQDLAMVMIVAAVVTVVFHRLRQPVVLGYIIAGIIVGPYTAGLTVQDRHTVEIMAELGVILLMFGLGLHFSIRKLASVGATALIAASLEIVSMVAIGYIIGRAFGWSWMDSIFLGAILSISSTTIIVKALAELGLSKQPFSQLVFGILIIEDILGIAMMALLSSIAMTGTLGVSEITMTLGKLGIFLAGVLVLGLLVVPWLLRYISRFKSDETLLITALGLCFGISLLAMKMGYSVALGAFLIGAVIAETRQRGRIETLIEPVRDMFSAVFFVAVGMLIEPKTLVEYWLPILVVTIAVVVGKVIACGLGTFLAGHDGKTSIRVGMSIAQIGEFSFIIATLGLTLKVTSSFLYPIAVTVSAITTLLTPYLIRSSDWMTATLVRVVPQSFSEPMQVYSRWMASPSRKQSSTPQIQSLIRKWVLQIALNLALVAAIFITLAAIAKEFHSGLPQLPNWAGGSDTLMWLAAMLLSLPLIVASVRKLRAMALVLAEMSVPQSAAGAQTVAIRAVISNTILGIGCAAIFVLVLIAGTPILPRGRVAFILIAIVGLIAAIAWRWLVRVYARAQISLEETLTAPQVSHEQAHVPADQPTLPDALKEAELETVELAAQSPATGKLIRELQLRSLSGASAVAIERGQTNLVNPGPDEELTTGDKVILLGSRAQLDAARKLLSGR